MVSPKLRLGAALALLIAIIAAMPALGASRDPLPANYRHWLDRDAAYLITKEEREAFVRLTSNEARDAFIQRFWELRNPTPGAPSNPFKEEHYRRIAYANQYFSTGAGEDGWRSARGRVYITLGEPQQRAKYLTNQHLKPMEIWFHQSSHPALPPFFFVVFFKREISDDFRLYSPYSDGPEALITSFQEGNDRRSALGMVDRSAGREVARTTLSLLPDEPVDMNTATTSLQSDVLLSTIRNLANHPLTKEELNHRRELLESVSHRMVLGAEFLTIFTVPLREPDGSMNVHYLLRLKKPEDFKVAQSGERYYYSFSVSAQVRTADDKPVYTQERKVTKYLSPADYERIKGSLFGFEGMLPLAPGKYKVDFLFSDLLKKTAVHALRDVVVPPFAAEGLRLDELVPFASVAVTRDSLPVRPFGMAGVKFTPLAQPIELTPGEDLNVFYQLWEPPADPAANRGKKLDVEYVYGRLGAPIRPPPSANNCRARSSTPPARWSMAKSWPWPRPRPATIAWRSPLPIRSRSRKRTARWDFVSSAPATPRGIGTWWTSSPEKISRMAWRTTNAP